MKPENENPVFYFEAWRRACNYSGRATRTEYWSFNLVNLVVLILSLAIWIRTGGGVEVQSYLGEAFPIIHWNAAGRFFVVFALVAIIPSINVNIRRVRDATGSGWWILLGLVPSVVGVIFFTYAEASIVWAIVAFIGYLIVVGISLMPTYDPMAAAKRRASHRN